MSQANLKIEIFNVATILAGRSLDGLAFVPYVIDRFEVGPDTSSNRAACHKLLKQLEDDGFIELLTTDSRLTSAALEACLKSQEGSALAWIRICNFDGLEENWNTDG